MVNPLFALAFLMGLILLGILGHCFGVDSSERLRSEEEELAAFGVTWQDLYPYSTQAVDSDSGPAQPAQSKPGSI